MQSWNLSELNIGLTQDSKFEIKFYLSLHPDLLLRFSTKLILQTKKQRAMVLKFWEFDLEAVNKKTTMDLIGQSKE